MGASGHASAQAVVGVTVSLTVLAAIATALRLFTRLLIVRSAGLDDALIGVAMMLSIAVTVTMCEQVNHGLARHFTTLAGEEATSLLQWMWASIWIYYLALGAAKSSILLQYLRVFPHRRFRQACYVMLGIVAAYTLWGCFSAIFACFPVESFWDHNLHGHCLGRTTVWYFNAAVNIATDIGTAILPLPLIRSLNMPRREQNVLMAVFVLGSVSCIVSILRLPSLYAIAKTMDASYENPLAAIWSSVEVNIAILSSCIPTVKGFVKKFFPRVFSTSRTRSEALDMPQTPRFVPRFTGGTMPSECAYGGDFEQERNGKDMDKTGIHVTTKLEQAIDADARSQAASSEESGSIRHLVPGGQTHQALH